MARFETDGSPLYGLMLDIVSYLKEQSDRFHHPREDAAFVRMVQHDPTLRLPINRLLQEHRAIAVAGDELTTHLNEVIVENVVERATVESAVALYLSYYRHHLATEENEILPRAANLMTAQDWATVAAPWHRARTRCLDRSRKSATGNCASISSQGEMPSAPTPAQARQAEGSARPQGRPAGPGRAAFSRAGSRTSPSAPRRLLEVGVRHDAVGRADQLALRLVLGADAFGAAQRVDHVDRVARR